MIEEPDGCVDCDGYVPAEFGVVTDVYVIDGEVYEFVEKMCLKHRLMYGRRPGNEVHHDLGSPD